MSTDHSTPAETPATLFRSEAIDYYRRDAESLGFVGATTQWTKITLLLSALLIAAATIFLALTNIATVDRVDGVVQPTDTSCESGVQGCVRVTTWLPQEKTTHLRVGDVVAIELRDVQQGKTSSTPGIIRALDSQHNDADRELTIEVNADVLTTASINKQRLLRGTRVVVKIHGSEQSLLHYLIEPLQRARS